ncbi:MAG: hypothetical protein IPJ82_19975 [Lewinellaceae bacterium]|nr:hypothetical protein [Lewinellaceae bacterium]
MVDGTVDGRRWTVDGGRWTVDGGWWTGAKTTDPSGGEPVGSVKNGTGERFGWLG